ncbi:uncharacterized protein LOC142230848 [Haematobia irritans]|uniref:uncharacterized protein LOC142230848 n=1 Tax=Haematobia irritans TaxID=7368 RepID=UPI003F50CA87
MTLPLSSSSLFLLLATDFFLYPVIIEDIEDKTEKFSSNCKHYAIAISREVVKFGNITELSDRFYSVLQDCISKSVPRFTVDNNSGPPWKTRVLMRLKNRKHKMFRKFKKSGSSLDFSNYSIARSKYNLENKLPHRNYLSRMKEQLRVDPKSFYKFVNSKRQSNTLPTYLKYQSLTADNDMDISDLFAEFFATTYSDRSYDCSNTYPIYLLGKRCLQTDTIYTDFSKAFDKVNHALLLRKLDMIGFSNSLLKWFQSYLIGRTQCVKFGNATSRYVSVTSGVPQGSHLGPVLFCLFINDLPSIIKYSNILMFADDVKLFRSFNVPVDQYYLQIDLDNFSNWCELNLMELNTSKCKLMRFSRGTVYDSSYIIGSTRLEAVDSFKDLGLLMDQRLNFRQHISMAISKAYVTLGFMKRWSKEFRDYSVTKILYTILVRSHIEYGSTIWDPYYTIHSDKIESVQKQFLLFCLRHRGWDPQSLPSYEFRLNLIKLPSLSSRRTMLNICYIMNIIQGEIG